MCLTRRGSVRGNRYALWFALFLVAWLPGARGFAQETAPSSIQPEIGSIQKTISMTGYFAPAASTEIAVKLESNLALKVLKAVEHGTNVRTGDVLIEFDAHDAKQQLEQQEFALAMQKLQLEEADREDRIAQAKDPIDEEYAELAKRRADEDFAFFMERDFPMSQRSVEQSLKSMKDYLDYTAEELRQLEKMYKADDLTEESEEIVLRRARDDLDRSRFAFDREQLNHRRSVEFSLPRDKMQQQTQHRLAELAFEQFKSTRPLVLEKRRLALKKMHLEFERASQELDKLRSDLKKFRVEAPHDGIVYFGKATDGKFGNIAEMAAKLRPHGVASPNDVLLTIVRPDAMVFSGAISEADWAQSASGTVASIVPTASPKTRIDAAIQRVASVPGADGSFAVHLELRGAAPKKVVPGMTGKASWIAYFNPKAVLVPSRYVHPDPNQEGVHHVFVLNAESKPEKRLVECGVVAGERTEIVGGLTGDEKLVESDGAKK